MRDAVSVFLLGAVLFMVTVLAVGCAPTFKSLGLVRLADDSVIEAVQITSKGENAPKLVVIETFAVVAKPDGTAKNVKIGEYQAAGDSLTAKILSNSGAAVLHGAGYAGAAALRKPSRTSTTVTGGSTSVESNFNSEVNTDISTEVDSSIGDIEIGGDCQGNCGGNDD